MGKVARVVIFPAANTASAVQAAIDRYFQSLHIHGTLVPPHPLIETLAKTYTVKTRLVSCPPTTEVNSLSRQQASRSNRIFLIMCHLIMNIKVQLVYFR